MEKSVYKVRILIDEIRVDDDGNEEFVDTVGEALTYAEYATVSEAVRAADDLLEASSGLCSTGEAARKLGISGWKLEQWIAREILPEPDRRVGNRRMFTAVEITSMKELILSREKKKKESKKK